MMQAESKEHTDTKESFSLQDQAAVAAVRRGDPERFRELVERHERRVYAVAWSRLGDPALAEEATQESFIRAYRRLWLLGDGSKFAAWIGTIARHVAINFGLRHRRELNKRKRWALEQPAEPPTADSSETTEAPCSPEVLRTSLSDLPAAHRECLVLFYLEGKSGAEAADILGISESALRVRLHRARAALRQKLQERLETSLAHLRPDKSLAPAIMAGIFATTSAKAATTGSIGSAMLGSLAKWMPFKLSTAIFPFLFALPVLFFSWVKFQNELANYRDKEGFRVRLMKEQSARGFVILTMMMLTVLVVMHTLKLGDRNELFLLMGGIGLLGLPSLLRRLTIVRNRFYFISVISTPLVILTSLLVGLDLVPLQLFNVAICIQALLTMMVRGQRPARLDYNLFLRAAEGLLKPSNEDPPKTEPVPRPTRSELLGVAQFLGSRWLVEDFRWQEDGLLLRLPSVHFFRWMPMREFGAWTSRSRILLGADRNVEVVLTTPDRKSILRLSRGREFSPEDLERQVRGAVKTAWSELRRGRTAEAEAALGQTPEEEIFFKPPSKAGAARWPVRILMFVLVCVVILLSGNWIHPIWLSRMKPVRATEQEVRHFLNTPSTTLDVPSNPPQPGKASQALFLCLVTPSTNLFTAESLLELRKEASGPNGFQALRQEPNRVRYAWAVPLLRNALGEGWILWSELGLQPHEVAESFRQDNRKGNPMQFELLTQCQAWSWVRESRYRFNKIQRDGLVQLKQLKAIGGLDLIDRPALVKKIRSAQILSKTPVDQPAMPDWKAMRGLFYTPCFPALEDTYLALAALEILDALNEIDREACIQGILRVHGGKGYFASPTPGGYNEYHIEGGCRDTFSAYESLRILGALDRVPDLESWEFRVASRNRTEPVANGTRNLTWEEVEAWICEQRFQQILRNRKSNPTQPFESLAKPGLF